MGYVYVGGGGGVERCSKGQQFRLITDMIQLNAYSI